MKLESYVVGVVQLAEHRIVVPGVVGSSPITHPIKKKTIRSSFFMGWMGLERATERSEVKSVRGTLFSPWESPWMQDGSPPKDW